MGFGCVDLSARYFIDGTCAKSTEMLACPKNLAHTHKNNIYINKNKNRSPKKHHLCTHIHGLAWTYAYKHCGAETVYDTKRWEKDRTSEQASKRRKNRAEQRRVDRVRREKNTHSRMYVETYYITHKCCSLMALLIHTHTLTARVPTQLNGTHSIQYIHSCVLIHARTHSTH